MESSCRDPADVPVEPGNSKAGASSQPMEPECFSHESITGRSNPTPQAPPDCSTTPVNHYAASHYAKPSPAVAQAVHRPDEESREPKPKSVAPPALMSSQDGLGIKGKLFAALGERPTGNDLMSDANCGPFISPMFIQLPPKSQVQSIFGISFDNKSNYSLPLFDAQFLISLAQEHYADPIASPGTNPARWAMINSALAVAIQSRSAPDSQAEMTKISWCFFKNAFSVYSAIALRGADILALEALLARPYSCKGPTTRGQHQFW